MLSDFYVKTTKAFDVVPTIDGVAQSITDTTLEFILKKDRSLPDSKADIYKSNSTGSFILTPDDTDVEPRVYYYEIKWEVGAEVYILESGTVTALTRVFE